MVYINPSQIAMCTIQWRNEGDVSIDPAFRYNIVNTIRDERLEGDEYHYSTGTAPGIKRNHFIKGKQIPVNWKTADNIDAELTVNNVVMWKQSNVYTVQELNAGKALIWAGEYRDSERWPVAEYETADRFMKMGYVVDVIPEITKEQLLDILPDYDVMDFYAHGDSIYISIRVGEGIAPDDIPKHKLKFVFAHTCDGLAWGSEWEGTWAYVFNENRGVFVSYNNGDDYIREFDDLADWINSFYERLIEKDTIGEAFARANQLYPNVATYDAVRVDGDTSLVIHK